MQTSERGSLLTNVAWKGERDTGRDWTVFGVASCGRYALVGDGVLVKEFTYQRCVSSAGFLSPAATPPYTGVKHLESAGACNDLGRVTK